METLIPMVGRSWQGCLIFWEGPDMQSQRSQESCPSSVTSSPHLRLTVQKAIHQPKLDKLDFPFTEPQIWNHEPQRAEVIGDPPRWQRRLRGEATESNAKTARPSLAVALVQFEDSTIPSILWVHVHVQRPALCDPLDRSPPGASVRGIFQARILEWVVISSSRGSSQPRDGTCNSCVSCTRRQILYHCTT